MPPRPRYPIVIPRRTVPDANGDFRSSHSARELAEEAERFSLDDYRDRDAADGFAESLHSSQTGRVGRYDPVKAKGVAADFLKGTHEETRTWGNSQPFSFVTDGTGDAVLYATVQLIHVSRWRPTSFTVQTVMTLISGWTPEAGAGGLYNLFVDYILGVGQTSIRVQKKYPLTPLFDGNGVILSQPVNDVLTFPANAIQATATIIGTSRAAGVKTGTIAQLAAPIYA